VSTTLRRPVNRVGPATKRWARWEKHCEQEVLKRNMRLRFGLCDIEGCKNRYSDRAHLFGRAATGARLGEPWCSLPELCLALCRQHHNLIDRGLAGELQASLRWTAIGRLTERFNQPALNLAVTTRYTDPIDAVRWAVDALEKAYEYDPETLSFSKREAA
jgi:hypothetical protein